jgi:hypothetical protein
MPPSAKPPITSVFMIPPPIAPIRPPLAADSVSSSSSNSVPKNLVPAILGVSKDKGFTYPVGSGMLATGCETGNIKLSLPPPSLTCILYPLRVCQIDL